MRHLGLWDSGTLAMIVFNASYFTGDKPKSSSVGMSSMALPPVARIVTMKRSRLWARSSKTHVWHVWHVWQKTYPDQAALSQRPGHRSSPLPVHSAHGLHMIACPSFKSGLLVWCETHLPWPIALTRSALLGLKGNSSSVQAERFGVLPSSYCSARCKSTLGDGLARKQSAPMEKGMGTCAHEPPKTYPNILSNGPSALLNPCQDTMYDTSMPGAT